MLNRDKVITSLENKKERFLLYGEEQAKQRQELADQFEVLRHYSADRILAALAAADVAWPGALPTPEVDEADAFRLAFPQQWTDHRAARTWALTTLYNRPVIAVDGSQLPPTKDFSIPVGAVQIGWFINDHIEGRGGYVKDLDFEVLAPDELEDEDESDSSGGMGFPNWRINQLRFVRECEKLCELMAQYDHVAQDRKPLCFFDGSFIISFAGQMRPDRARPYIDAVERLLKCSETYRVPVVGFVDSTYSRDVVNMLGVISGKPISIISDARLFDPVLPHWGDRTPLLLCARGDALTQPRGGGGRAGVDFYAKVAFTYVRLTSDRPPSRVEMPRWVMDEGLAEGVIDRVRAESVVGNGYPYAIETADAVAVITAQDRERFYALFQQFAQREGMPLRIARKAVSKIQRR